MSLWHLLATLAVLILAQSLISRLWRSEWEPAVSERLGVFTGHLEAFSAALGANLIPAFEQATRAFEDFRDAMQRAADDAFEDWARRIEQEDVKVIQVEVPYELVADTDETKWAIAIMEVCNRESREDWPHIHYNPETGQELVHHRFAPGL